VITIPAGVRIYLACGVTDMRRGFDGLSIPAQDVLKQDPFSGAIFCFRGRRGDLVKILVLGRPGASACSPSGWRRAALPGRRRRKARLR
jgi:transposase